MTRAPHQTRLFIVLATLPFIALSAEAERQPPREKLVMGWLESVFLRPWNLRVTAKLDTGANTSSLHADQIEHFSKDGEAWVRFTLEDGQGSRPQTVERPIVRAAYIKERLGRSSKRDVVKLTVCKNGRDYETEFTLVDRSNFNYPLLLGRSFLQDVALVDASATFLYKADGDLCKPQTPAPSKSGGGK
ncbi:ATP-dependent zinc protease family protein [Methylomagnum sp.]